MPIFMKIEGVKGAVEARGASGGVWKTTNFLTTGSVGPRWSGARGGALENVGGNNTWAANAVPVSRISLTLGGGGVEGRDAAAKLKVEQLIRSARSQAPNGRLYVATDAGVYAGNSNNRGNLLVGVDSTRSPRSDAQGRLLLGSDQGVWRSGGANKLNGSNNLTSVEIIVADAGGIVVGSHRLPNVTVTGSSGTFTLTFNGQTTGG